VTRTGARRAAGLVVLRPGPAGWRCLVLRAYRNWDLPKGRIEPGETPLAAALRETTEETSLEGLELRWGEAFRETEPYAGGKVARFYVAVSRRGEVRLPVSSELGRPEHHEYRWVDFAEADRLLPPRLRAVVGWARTLAERGPGAASDA
jgi:bis(5'-nucleosidyl)-tetraphosphatase